MHRLSATSPEGTKPRSEYSHYLPRLLPEFYQADAVVFWTLPINRREQGWLTVPFHAVFRETMLHAAAREALLCPAYCLMPDHIHLVWMGLRQKTDQRKAMTFLRTHLAESLEPACFQCQPHDHVLDSEERRRDAFGVACAEYVLFNPEKAGLTNRAADWRYTGAIVPGYPRLDPFSPRYWPWFWERHAKMRELGIERRVIPPRGVA